jgi:hypothetical protein
MVGDPAMLPVALLKRPGLDEQNEEEQAVDDGLGQVAVELRSTDSMTPMMMPPSRAR